MTRGTHFLRDLAGWAVRRLGRRARARHRRASGGEASMPPSGPRPAAGVDGYLCEVVASALGTPLGEGGREFYLGGYWADTPQDAVRWLASWSSRLADRLDPRPGHGWARGEAARALRRLPDTLPAGWPDPGPVLRGWCADEVQRRKAVRTLRAGEPVGLATGDGTASYAMTARPVSVPWTTPTALHDSDHMAA